MVWYVGRLLVECAVCLCEVGVVEEASESKCYDHVFHRACLNRWLNCKSATCPLCSRFVACRRSVSTVTEAGGGGHNMPKESSCCYLHEAGSESDVINQHPKSARN
ncbi:hypothetical protein NL676_001597 [Syzygium grande]|nr:hypothetical protein NL676_001597 [Syzygium grande]